MEATTAAPKRPRRQLIDETKTDAPVEPVTVPAGVVEVRLDLIDFSPKNPRKDFDQKEIEDLGADIAMNGVLQAIGLKPRGERFELIWGERRVRASKLIGKETILARIIDADEQTIDVMRFSENKHESLSALDLAGGYAQLMQDYGFNLVQLAEKVKRSEASVRDTLALNKLGPSAKRALHERKLNPSTAMLIAPFPPGVQTSIVMDATSGEEPMSFRELKELIAKDWVLDLEAARFEQHDAQLVPSAGACTGCPWRDKSACRNLPCYRSKEEAWLDRQRKNGRKVLTTAEADQAFPFGDDRPSIEEGYVLADDVDGYSPDDDETWRDKLGKDAQKHLVLARTPRGTLVDLFPTSVLPKRKRGDEPADLGDEQPEVDAAEAKKAQRAAAKEERERIVRRETALSAINALVDSVPENKKDDTHFLRVIAFAYCDDSSAGKEELRRRLALPEGQTLWGYAYSLRGPELRALLLQIALARAIENAGRMSEYPEALREACGLMGVNLDAIEKKTRERLKKGRRT